MNSDLPFGFKVGDLVEVDLLPLGGGQRVRVTGIAELRGDICFIEVADNDKTRRLNFEVVSRLVVPNTGGCKWRYRGEIQGAIMVPKEFFKRKKP